MAAPDGGEQHTESLYDPNTRPRESGSAVDYPPLTAAPLYLPNLIAAIVASVGIIIGSIGTWATLDGTAGVGGMDVPDSWGVVTLSLGAASAIALFAQLNWGRTSSGLRWAVPLVWAVVVAGVGCLAIALVHIATVNSVNSFMRVLIGHSAQIGWGLWLAAICSAVLCVTTAIVAVQVGNASQDHSRPAQAAWAGAWRWVAIGASAVVLVIAVLNSYRPFFGNSGSEQATATETQTVTAPRASPPTETVAAPRAQLPSPVAPGGADDSLPPGATHCTSNPVSVMFNNSAAGTEVTSCQFAEAVRGQYVQQPRRNTTVTLTVFSPVTSQDYPMTCTGNHIVTCSGGNSAVVYIY